MQKSILRVQKGTKEDDPDRQELEKQILQIYDYLIEKKQKVKKAELYVRGDEPERELNYFRGDEFLQLFIENIEYMQNLFQDYHIDLTSEEKVVKFQEQLIDNHILQRLERAEPNNLKYPKHLMLSGEPNFSKKMFYTWSINATSGISGIKQIFISLLALYFLYQCTKYLNNYIQMIAFLIAEVIVIVLSLRLSIWAFSRIFKVSIWFLPKIRTDFSVRPQVTINRVKRESRLIVIFRILGAIYYGYMQYLLIFEHKARSESFNSITEFHQSLFKWGQKNSENYKKEYYNNCENIKNPKMDNDPNIGYKNPHDTTNHNIDNQGQTLSQKYQKNLDASSNQNLGPNTESIAHNPSQEL